MWFFLKVQTQFLEDLICSHQSVIFQISDYLLCRYLIWNPHTIWGLIYYRLSLMSVIKWEQVFMELSTCILIWNADCFFPCRLLRVVLHPPHQPSSTYRALWFSNTFFFVGFVILFDIQSISALKQPKEVAFIMII